MAYCDEIDVRTMLSTEGLESMMDDEDQSRYSADILQICDWATAIVNQYLLPRYPTGLSGSEWVNFITTKIAVRQFAVRRLNSSNPSLDADIAEIMKELRLIRVGTYDLAGVAGNSTVTPGVRVFRYDGRRFPQKVVPQQTTSTFGPSNIPQRADWSDWIPADWGWW